MTRARSPLAMGYSILAGPILWFVHFIVVYTIAEFGCRANFNNAMFISPGAIQTVTLVLTVVVLFMVGAAAILSYRGWQTMRNTGEDSSPTAARIYFLSMMGILLSSLFLFVIILTAIPAFVLSACDKVA